VNYKEHSASKIQWLWTESARKCS